MGDTSTDLINLSSIEELTLNHSLNNSTLTNSDHVCDSIKPSSGSVFKMHQPAGSQPLLLDDYTDTFTSRRTKERIDEFEAQLECFMQTKKLLIQQFNEESQNMMQKHEREILGLRQKHLVCENNFKSQLENATQRIKSLEVRLEKEQKSLKLKIAYYEEKIQQQFQETKTNQERLEAALDEKDRQIDEMKQQNLDSESRLKLLNSEFQNRRQQLDDKIREYECNQQKDSQEIKKLREELNNSMKEIQTLQRNLADTRELLERKESQCSVLEKELDDCKKQIQLDAETKQESVMQLEALKETLQVSQNENDVLQKKLAETQTRMEEEIEKLKSEVTVQQNHFEQRFRRSLEERNDAEHQLKSEISTLEKALQDSKKQCDQLKAELEKAKTDKHQLQHQLEKQIQQLTSDKQTIEQSYNLRINDLNRKLSDMEQKLADLTEKYQLSQNESIQAHNYIQNLESDLKTKNSEILNVHEKYNLLEMDRLSMLNELENVKRLLHLESVEKKEKLRQIEELNDSLSSSQIEIEKLKNVNEQLKRSLEDGDNLRLSILKDCNELRETLAEVEKSRLDIKSKLNSCQFNCASLQNQLKKKDLEIEDLKRKLGTYNEEKKFWQQDLDSTSQSLTQMKTAYDRLYQQNVLLQTKLSQSESKTKTDDSMMIAVKNGVGPNEKETLKRLTMECEQSREKIAKLESEKKHFERLYVNIERDYNNLKKSFNMDAILMQAPSPPHNNPAILGTLADQSINDHSASVLRLSHLLKNDPFELDDTNKSLETLRQKNMELKQKVLGKQNTASPLQEDKKIISSKLTTASNNNGGDYCECLHYHQSQRLDSGIRNHVADTNHLVLVMDENKNMIELDNDNSFDEKLRAAELNAQKVLESCEPEIRKLSNKTRIKSAIHHKHHIKSSSQLINSLNEQQSN